MLCHGRSPDWDRAGDFQDRIARAAGAHLTAPMDVIGHSFGATVAVRVAALFPERVRSLTLIESVYFAGVGRDQPHLLEAEQADAALFRDAVLAGQLEEAARIFNSGWGNADGPAWDTLPEASRAAMARGVQIVPACGASIIEDCHGMLEPGGLNRIACPVLLLRGDQTAEIIAEVNAGLQRRLPNARSEVIQGTGHMAPISHPEATAAHIRRFWQDVPAAS